MRFLAALKRELFNLRRVIKFYAIFGCSSDIFFLRDSLFTQHFQECNRAYNENPVYGHTFIRTYTYVCKHAYNNVAETFIMRCIKKTM